MYKKDGDCYLSFVCPSYQQYRLTDMLSALNLVIMNDICYVQYSVTEIQHNAIKMNISNDSTKTFCKFAFGWRTL